MAEFTNAEIERINTLYGNDFADITPEDAQLIGRWEASQAIKSAEVQAEIDAINERSQQAVEQSAQVYQVALNNLNELHAAALARLEAFNDGI